MRLVALLGGADGEIVADGGNNWLSFEGYGTPEGLVNLDASALDYMFLVHSVSTAAEEISLSEETGVSIANFDALTDRLYIDYQNPALPLPTNIADALTYDYGSAEGAGAAYNPGMSSNLEGVLSRLEFLGLTQTLANQAVLVG